MRAWQTTASAGELELVDRADPVPGPDDVLVRVEACGICRTDLHVVDRELPERKRPVIPGHQAVGEVVARGDRVVRMRVGQRVGIAWLRRTCGECRWCREGAENLCPASEHTGWDADGGFAELVASPAAFAYPLPREADALQLAPLLCAGIIGYRALRRAELPPAGRLGIYGFGSSAHITAQLAIASGAEVHVITRGAENRELARQLGAASAGDESDEPPVPLDSAIVFAPDGPTAARALRATERGGTVVLAGIHLSDLPSMDYASHLFQERTLRSVTANTRADGAALLRLAERLRLTARVTPYAFERAADALGDLRDGRASGSLVLGVADAVAERPPGP